MTVPFTNVHSSSSVGTSEFFLFSASTTATYQTTAAKITGYIDFVNMTAAETYDVKLYEKVNAGTAKLITSARLVGVQSELFWIPEFWAVEGYEIGVTKVAGTDRTIIWSLNRDFGNVNVQLISDDATAADNLELQYDTTGLVGATFPTRQDAYEIRRGTCQAGSISSTIVLDSGASSTNDFYNISMVTIVGGLGAGQPSKLLWDYVGATRTASIYPSWNTTPDNTSVFVISPWPGATVSSWNNNNPSNLSTVDANGNPSVNIAAVNQLTASAQALARTFDSAAVTTISAGFVTRRNTAQTGSTSSTIKLDAGASATNNLYNNSAVAIYGGTGAGQGGRTITAYDGTTKVATITPNWDVTPDNTSTFEIMRVGGASAGGASAGTIAAAVWDEARAGHTTAGTYGKTSEWAGTSSLTAADISDAVWDEVLSGHLTAGTTGAALNTAQSASGATPSTIADAVWDELASGHTITGSMGANLQTLANTVAVWPPSATTGVTASTLIDRAMAISDMHDNFVNTTEWLSWLNSEQDKLQLFLARAGWALPFDTTTATITSTGWDLSTNGGSNTSVALSAGHYVFTPGSADVMALVCVHESRSDGLRLLTMENDVDFLRQLNGSTLTTSHATCYRVRTYGAEIHLNFYPTPQAGETYLITFLPRPGQFTSTTQMVSLPMGWEERLVLGMARKALIKEESDPSQVEKLMTEMDREIEELCWNRVTSTSPRVRGTDRSLQSYQNSTPPWQNWYWF